MAMSSTTTSGFSGLGLFDRLTAIGGFGHHVETGLAFEQQPQASAHYVVIIG